MKSVQVINKCKRVIDSCIKPQQLHVAGEYNRLLINRWYYDEAKRRGKSICLSLAWKDLLDWAIDEKYKKMLAL